LIGYVNNLGRADCSNDNGGRVTVQLAFDPLFALYLTSSRNRLTMEFTAEEKRTLLKIARGAITAALSRKSPEEYTKEYLITPAMQMKAGAFVTLEIHHRLRGCVGLIESEKPLCETVSEAAVSAALYDSRFRPLASEELPEIEIEISVLSPMVKMSNVDSLEVNKHGLLMISGRNHGLLLPQVATEYRWDKTTFLEQTCVKAGLPKDAWKWPETEVYLFTANVFNEAAA